MNKVDPTGTGHETRIVVGITGKGYVQGTALVNDKAIGNIYTGQTVSSDILTPGTYTVRMVPADQTQVVWQPVTVELKEGVNYAVNFTADFKKIRVTLGAECIGTINEATVFINGKSAGVIIPGGFVLDENQPPGTHVIELKQGTKVIGTQTVVINSFGGTQTVSFGC